MTDRTDSNHADIDEDAKVERMRQEFESFMLSGKTKPRVDEGNSLQGASNQSKKKKKKKGRQSIGDSTGSARASGDDATVDSTPTSASVSTSTSSTILGQCTKSTSRTTDKKRYFQLLRSFNDKVQHSWLDTDDQMLSIIENIVSIRGRLPIEWKLLHLASSQSSSPGASSNERGMNPQADDDDDSMFRDKWKNCGFLGKPKETPYSSVHLHIDDIQLALSNDLMQHEKMLLELRRQMSQLAECQEAVGRIVENLWQFHLECCSGVEDDVDEKEQDGAAHDMENDIVQGVTEVFHMLSMELHRKQKIVPMIIESTKDDLLGIKEDETADEGVPTSVGEDGSDDANWKGSGGLQAARKCCKIWNRSSVETCIDMSLIAYLIKLGGGVEDRKEHK
jgi:hypothetical protein